MKGALWIESLAIWAVALLWAIYSGWGQNGFSMPSDVQWAVGIVLLLAVLMETARAHHPNGVSGMGGRLVQWWAVGSGWVFLVWFLSWGPLAPKGLLSLFMVVGLATGLLIMGALGSVALLMLVVMSDRRVATASMIGVEALMVLFFGLRLERFFLLTQGGALLAPWWERMSSLGAVVWLLDQAWPIGAVAVGMAVMALSIRLFVQRDHGIRL